MLLNLPLLVYILLDIYPPTLHHHAAHLHVAGAVDADERFIQDGDGDISRADLARPDFVPPVGYFLANDVTARILIGMAPRFNQTVAYLDASLSSARVEHAAA